MLIANLCFLCHYETHIISPVSCNARFGECHPVFYIGSLENALKDALQCRARDVSVLFVAELWKLYDFVPSGRCAQTTGFTR